MTIYILFESNVCNFCSTFVSFIAIDQKLIDRIIKDIYTVQTLEAVQKRDFFFWEKNSSKMDQMKNNQISLRLLMKIILPNNLFKE